MSNMTSGDMVVVAVSIIFTFVMSHILVDKEFPKDVRNGAVAVMGVCATLYLIFGVLI